MQQITGLFNQTCGLRAQEWASGLCKQTQRMSALPLGLGRLVTRLRSYHEKMVEAGYQPIVFEDYMDMLADQLNAINGGADALTLPVRGWI